MHRHPPSSGLGSNTCMQDAFNLAWKLAYVIKGYAGESLLDSYSLERAPVGRQIVARANQSRKDYGPLNETFRVPGQEHSIEAGLARLHAPTPEGVELRQKLQEALELKNYEFNAHGVELNQRYESAAVIPDPDSGGGAVGQRPAALRPADHPAGSENPARLACGPQRQPHLHP